MVARDNNADVINNATVSPATGSYTCTGSNRFLFILASTDNTGAISAVTYNGVSATLINSIVRPAPQDDRKIFLYGLEAPASGSNTLSITFTAGHLWAACASYTGVLQSGEPHANNTGSQAEPGTLTVSATVNNNSWLVGQSILYTTTTTAGTGTSKVATLNNSVDLWDSNASLAAGSQSLNMIATGGTGHDAMIIAAIGDVASGNRAVGFII